MQPCADGTPNCVIYPDKISFHLRQQLLAWVSDPLCLLLLREEKLKPALCGFLFAHFASSSIISSSLLFSSEFYILLRHFFNKNVPRCETKLMVAVFEIVAGSFLKLV